MRISNKVLQSLTKKDVFNDINNLFKKHKNISATIYFKEGKYSRTVVNKLFGSFFNMLNEYNLIHHSIDNIPEKYLINEDELIILAGILFTQNQLYESVFYKQMEIPINKFEAKYGSFKNFLKEIGLYELVRKIKNDKLSNKRKQYDANRGCITDFTEEDVINKMHELHDKIGYFNGGDFLKQSKFARSTLLKLNKTYTELLKEAGYFEEFKKIGDAKHGNKIRKVSQPINNVLTKIELTTTILNYVNNNNVSKLRAGDLYQNTSVTQSQILKFWPSFTDMTKELNLGKPPELLPTKEEIITHMNYLRELNDGKLSSTIQRQDGKYDQKTIHKVFGSFTQMLKEMNLPLNINRLISTEDLLNDLKRLVGIHGTINQVIIEHEGKYSYPTYIYNLGGNLMEISKLLNIIYNPTNSISVSDAGIYCIYLIAKILNDQDYKLEATFDWLRNPTTNAKLKVDGYFPNYNLIIEYDGPQHFKRVDFFYKTKGDFKNQIYKDKVKNKLCLENNFKLVRIKYDEKLTVENLTRILIENNVISP